MAQRHPSSSMVPSPDAGASFQRRSGHDGADLMIASTALSTISRLVTRQERSPFHPTRGAVLESLSARNPRATVPPLPAEGETHGPAVARAFSPDQVDSRRGIRRILRLLKDLEQKLSARKPCLTGHLPSPIPLLNRRGENARQRADRARLTTPGQPHGLRPQRPPPRHRPAAPHPISAVPPGRPGHRRCGPAVPAAGAGRGAADGSGKTIRLCRPIRPSAVRRSGASPATATVHQQPTTRPSATREASAPPRCEHQHQGSAAHIPPIKRRAGLQVLKIRKPKQAPHQGGPEPGRLRRALIALRANTTAEQTATGHRGIHELKKLILRDRH